ncbi:hypothetical protein BWK58_02670, partial [Flavobacterium columnare]
MYFFVGFFLVVLAFFEILSKKNYIYKNLFSLIAILVLILFVSLRKVELVGTDSPAYFEKYKYFDWEGEYGYVYLNGLFSKILNFPYIIFVAFLNVISLILIYKGIKKMSPYIIVPLFIFYSDTYLYFNFSGIRQAIAISFTFFSIQYILKGQIKYFIF